MCWRKQQRAEKRLLVLEKAQEMIGSKSALEATCTLNGGEEKRSGSTVEEAYPEIQKAQRRPHSVRSLEQSLLECYQPNTCTS